MHMYRRHPARFSALLLTAMIEGEGGSGGGTGRAGGTEANVTGQQGGDPEAERLLADAAGSGGGDAGKPDGENAPQNGGQAGGSGTEGGAPNGDEPDWKARSRQHEDRYKGERKARTTAEQERDAANERLAAVLKAAGVGGDDEDPAKRAEQATATLAERENELRVTRVERAAEKAARAAGLDVDRFLDSRSVSAQLDKLDPTVDDFLDEVARITTEAAEKYPHLAAAPAQNAPKPPATGDMSGGGEPPPTGAMSVEDFRKARGERRRY